MKIGFDISQTGATKAGCGYYAYSLIKALSVIDNSNNYILYSTFGDFFLDFDNSKKVRIKKPNFNTGISHNSIEAISKFWNSDSVKFENILGSPDIIHSNNFYCPLHLKRAKLVYTLYDLHFLEYPEWTTERNRYGCFKGVLNASSYADHIVAISEYSKKHFLEIFPRYPEEKISVVYPSSRYECVLTRANCPSKFKEFRTEKFWLGVGTIEPRKNLMTLLKAYAKLKEAQKNVFPLLLAGGDGWLQDNFEETIEQLGIKENVCLLGYVTDSELQWLYENCFALIYPSFFEGFGMPVLEAMSLGAIVIASNVTSIPEIVGWGGISVNPINMDEIYDKMVELLKDTDYYLKLKKAACKKSGEFSWLKSAEKLLGIYNAQMSI